MKITIDKQSFFEKLIFTSRFISSRLTSQTVLQGVLLKKEEETLHFYSTNLSSYYHTQLKLEEKNKFQIIVEPKKLTEFLSFLPAGKLELEIKEKQLVVVCGKTQGEFPLFVEEEFPIAPKIEDKPQPIEAKFFTANLPLVLFAASSDEGRPVLTGVNFTASDGQFLMVATDGFRLSLLKISQEINLPPSILPASFLNEILRLATGEEKISLRYSLSEKIIYFKIGEHDLYTRLIEGEYPLFEKVIPAESAGKTTAEVDREEFLRNIKLISVFARDLSNIIIIEVKKDGLYLKPKADKGETNKSFQEADVSGEEQKAAFNYKFLLDFLNHISAKKIIIEITRSDAPVAFKMEGNPNFLHIIMPVRIQE